MNAEVQRLLELLEAERDAARRADVDQLVELQEQKRAHVAALAAQGLEPEEHEALEMAVRANLWLIHHLADCLRGLSAGIEAIQSSYGERGERIPPLVSRRHGAL